MAKYKIKEDCFARGQDGSCTILNTCFCVLTGKCSFYKSAKKAKSDAEKARRRAVSLGFYLDDGKYTPRGGQEP